MKYLLPTFWLLVTSYLLLVTFTSPVHAQTQGKEGWYCNGNAIWHYRSGFSGQADVNEFTSDCGSQICAPQPPTDPIYEQDVTCYDPSSLPPNGTGTTMHIINPITTQGNPETIGIGADKSCNDKIDSHNLEGTLKVGGKLLSCHVTDEHCGLENKHTPHHTNADGQEDGCNVIPAGPDDWSINSPHDVCTGEQIGYNPYDNKRCFKTIVCDTNSLGILDASLQTDDPVCSNDIKYQVVAGVQQTRSVAECRNLPHTIPAGENNKEILDNSVIGVQTNISNLELGTMPAGVCADKLKTCQDNTVNAGIITNDQVFNIQGFICSGALGHFLQNTPIFGPLLGFATVCPKNVLVGDRKTDCFAQYAKCVGKANLAGDVNDPQIQDCSMTDYKNPQGQQSVANQELKDISKNIGGENGVLGQTLPNINCPLDPNKNLNTEGYNLNDDRNPDLNSRNGMYLQANFPYGSCPPISPPNTRGGSSTNACQQACFSALDQDQQACESKTGHDKDNCGNDAAQKKDRCLIACG